jgi:hypothetical protein
VADTRVEQEDALGKAQLWQRNIENASKHEHTWRERGAAVVDRYRDERGMGNPSDSAIEKKFNILWSNTETLKGALFARMAEPDVRRRFSDPNDAARDVAIMLERALRYEMDIYDAQNPISAALEDYLLPGRGVVWVVYEPILVKEKITATMEGDATTIVAEEEVERIGDQRCRLEYVHWEDYREDPARRPEDVTWRARRHLLSRDDLIARKFKKANDIPLSWSPDGDEYGEQYAEMDARAEVWEIWDIVTRKRIYIAQNYNDVLAEDDDPYGLVNFWPCPTPLIAVSTTNSSIPVPEYTLYQDQARELDSLTTRISHLISGLKRRGVYDASVPELQTLANAGDNEFVPSENFAYLAQHGGLVGAFQVEDITSISTVVNGLYQQRNAVLQTIYEITGISDILRGTTRASETATAQQLKAQFGSMRLRRRQDDIQKYIRELFRIKAELIAEHYEPEVLTRMTGMEVTDDMLDIMRNDKLRSYIIDVETDSTIFADEEEEKRTRIQFADTMGAYLMRAIEVTRGAPEVTPLAFEILKFVAGAWKVGRTFEDTIEDTQMRIEKQLQAAMSQPQVSPEERAAAAKLEAEMQMENLKQQGKLADIQSRERTKMAEIEADSRASDNRVDSKENLALLDAELRIAEER